ncbi:MAG: hypothetical protein OXM55_00690 [Bdellovibrionales bacterium]|nr:hypothetical protein [Bdellovibrionales bacterium]
MKKKYIQLNGFIITMSLMGFSMFLEARVTVEQQLQNAVEGNLNKLDKQIYDLTVGSNSVFPAITQDLRKIFQYWEEDKMKIKELRQLLRQCEEPARNASSNRLLGN